jgi:hypothetical protein
VAGLILLTLAVSAGGCARSREEPSPQGATELTHEQTLEWIRENRAWRRARKVKPILVRAIDKDEVGKEFQTADRAVERAREGYVLCVGVAGEPWFQKAERVEARYDLAKEEAKQFSFDSRPRTYKVYRPKGDVRNWAAQVQGTWQGKEIQGFTIRPNYDVEHPLYSPAGGYVVCDDVADPYQGQAADVWLVQKALFESTYEWLP